jgi:hypothetical protein
MNNLIVYNFGDNTPDSENNFNQICSWLEKINGKQISMEEVQNESRPRIQIKSQIFTIINPTLQNNIFKFNHYKITLKQLKLFNNKLEIIGEDSKIYFLVLEGIPKYNSGFN